MYQLYQSTTIMSSEADFLDVSDGICDFIVAARCYV